MVKQDIVLMNSTGLHARPAQMVCSQTLKFKSKIHFESNDKIIDAKSILNIMAAGFGKGSKITIKCEGEDEEQALQAIVRLIEGLRE